jgi:hypothetical protein
VAVEGSVSDELAQEAARKRYCGYRENISTVMNAIATAANVTSSTKP